MCVLCAALPPNGPPGLLPPHPLLQPRRLTTGDLANTTNAWGSAATEAAATGGPPRRLTLQSPGLMTSAGGLGPEASETGRTEGAFSLNSPSGFSTLGGWTSRPSTATTTASRVGTAATERAGTAHTASALQAGAVGFAAVGSAGGGLTLPRIRTPDGAARDAKRSSGSISGQQSAAGLAGAAASSSAGAIASSVTFASASASSQRPSIKKGISMARVAFKDPSLPRDK